MRLGIIGGGNMGGAILRGILRDRYARPENLWLSDENQPLLQKLTQETGVHAAPGNAVLAQRCDMILLAVKPAYMNCVIEEIKPSLQDQAVISIAAGWSMETLRTALGEHVHILRVMPNTPAMVGEGLTALCAEHTFSKEEFDYAQGLFQSIGRTVTLPERLFDGVIALSGSSPAYMYMMIEAMADGGVQQGIPRAIAYQMAAQAMLGAARMVLETGLHPGVLKDAVCSPGGTTIEAVAALEKNGFRAAVLDAMDACAQKSRRMTNQ